MFDFIWKVKNSFRKVKRDVESFRENANDWIVFLDGKGNEMEKRLDKIESRVERLEDAVLRAITTI